jgi:UPF0716 family protein affecting phage T7 exclusion
MVISKRGKTEKSKKAMALETLGWWILGIIVLVVAIFGMIILKEKGFSAVEYMKSLFRFGS